MKIYNNTQLENTLLIEEAGQLKSAGFITSVQYTATKANLDSLRTQNSLLVRVGLFLLGAILFLSLCGVCSLFFINSGSDANVNLLVFLFTLVGFGGTEIIINHKNYYCSGLEEAFILGGQLAFIGFVYLLFEQQREIFSGYAALLIFALSVLRYINVLSVIGFFISIVYTVNFYFINNQSNSNHLSMQVFLLILSVLIYFLTNRIYDNLRLPFYAESINLIKTMSLILIYISGSIYFLLNFYFQSYSNEVSYSLPILVLFWFMTFLIPVIYIYFSIKNKNRIMLWIGCIALGFSIFTFRVYYHLVPVEFALIFGGALLFAMTLFVIRRLKNNEEGLTFKPDRYNDKNAFLNAEALMVVAQTGMKPIDNSEDSKPFSGGEGFNGGGAGGTF